MTERDWLAGLKVGDRVATTRHGGCGYSLFRVTRVTPTQIVVGANATTEKPVDRSAPAGGVAA